MPTFMTQIPSEQHIWSPYVSSSFNPSFSRFLTKSCFLMYRKITKANVGINIAILIAYDISVHQNLCLFFVGTFSQIISPGSGALFA